MNIQQQDLNCRVVTSQTRAMRSHGSPMTVAGDSKLRFGMVLALQFCHHFPNAYQVGTVLGPQETQI